MILIVILVALLNASYDFSIIIREISTSNDDEFQINGIIYNTTSKQDGLETIANQTSPNTAYIHKSNSCFIDLL